MKSLAVSGLRKRFDGTASNTQCTTEVPVDVSSGQGRQTARRADALVEFESRNRFFGRGVIVEVQHANESKNIPQVTADYLSADYSVFWADETCFVDDEFHLEKFDQAFDDDSGIAFSPYSDTPHEIWTEFEPWRWFSTPDGWHFEDPNPECSHEFKHEGDVSVCALCETRYQLHAESQFPMYAPAEEPRNQLGNVTYVRGGDDALESDGTPHVHVWTPKSRRERTTMSSCSRCRAKKITTPSETKIDYNAHSVEQLETPQMEHCQHEWRRTGSGEECWKCGKPKSERSGGAFSL